MGGRWAGEDAAVLRASVLEDGLTGGRRATCRRWMFNPFFLGTDTRDTTTAPLDAALIQQALTYSSSLKKLFSRGIDRHQQRSTCRRAVPRATSQPFLATFQGLGRPSARAGSVFHFEHRRRAQAVGFPLRVSRSDCPRLAQKTSYRHFLCFALRADVQNRRTLHSRSSSQDSAIATIFS